ncbi:MAG TPA: alpha/beta hydrolase [Polyangiales bacterium]|nr:alpha/beta hydrolase [Polyangiales bacterium]
MTQLHYELIQTRGLRFEVATAGEGDKLALLLHGFPECAYSYRHQIELLVSLGYRVWAPNMRGYGRTDRPLGVKSYAMELLESDVSDLIDASGAKSVLLVGHDWGGVVAWSYAMHGTRPIEQLVILNAPHPARFFQALRTVAQLKRSWYIFLFQLPWLPEYLIGRDRARSLETVVRGAAVHQDRFSDHDVDVIRDNASIPGALTAMINYYRASGRQLLSNKRGTGVKKIRVPTLLIWGERDIALGKELTYGVDNYVSNLTVRYIADASHWVQQDAPDAVNRELTAWLGGPKPEQLRASDVASDG